MPGRREDVQTPGKTDGTMCTASDGTSLQRVGWVGQVRSVSAWEQCNWGFQEHGLILIQNCSLQFLITDSIALTNKLETQEGKIRRQHQEDC